MGTIGSVRSWLAGKITDGAQYLRSPDLLIDALLNHAKTLGLTDQPGHDRAHQPGQVYAIVNNRIDSLIFLL